MKIRYFDNAATTPITEKVLMKMFPYLTKAYGNASAMYGIGRQSKKAIEEARHDVAKIINVNPKEVYFTASGSESDNTAIKGFAYAETEFGPDDKITREQIAAIMHRYAQYKGFDVTQGGMLVREYNDYEAISDYALSSMTWAVNAGLLKGKGNNNLAPQDNATRAEIAAILHRFIESNK